MQGWAVLVLLVGLLLRLRTTVVVLLSASLAGLGCGLSPLKLLEILGKAFLDNRNLTLFLLTLPAVATVERYGLKEWIANWIQRHGWHRPAQLLIGYQLFRVACGCLGLRLNGHPNLVRPMLAPMVCAETPEEQHETMKAAAAAAENYGNFYGQNLSPVGGGVLMAYATMKGLGYSVSLWRMVAFATFPCLLCLGFAALQFRKLSRERDA
ncbi:MAG: DUF969 family protein [Candidatus Eremiobacteraeota bacterium]|nr:DUF969 family protein [Candidatus Eremiobacteraeota bacterium]